MAENILIRDLSPEVQSELEKYKQKYGHKTNSKAVLAMVESHNSRLELIDKQRERIQELEDSLEHLEADIRTFFNAFEILKKTTKRKR